MQADSLGSKRHLGTQLRDLINSRLTRWRVAVYTIDNAAEIGRNSVSKHPIVENEQTGAVLREQECGFVRCLKPTQRHIYLDLDSGTFVTVRYFEYRIAAPVDVCR